MSASLEKKIQDFFSGYPVRKYPAKQILLFPGDTPSSIYHLVEGNVKTHTISYRGDEVVLSVIKPPKFFPMTALLNNSPNLYYFQSDTPIKIHIAPEEDVKKFIKSEPEVLYYFLSQSYILIGKMMDKIHILMAQGAMEHIIYEILNESYSSESYDPNNGDFVININEKDLAARAGVSRETVNRELGKLRQQGIIETKRKQIIIKNISALEKKIKRDII